MRCEGFFANVGSGDGLESYHAPLLTGLCACSRPVVQSTFRMTGFGSAPTASRGGKGRKQMPTCKKYLDAEAARILKACSGNVQLAQRHFMRRKFNQLREQAPDLYASLVLQQQEMLDGIRRRLSEPEREKLIELTWDVVASFLPATVTPYGPTGEMKRRINKIAKFVAVQPKATPKGAAILDVGCGDGSILPFLRDVGCRDQDYLGIDLSSTMIQTAARAFPHASFEHTSFAKFKAKKCAQQATCFGTVLFNGSLQFFDKPLDALSDAAALLPRTREGPRRGRIVISHAQGAAFVDQEKEGNPATVPSTLPDLSDLGAFAQDLNMKLSVPFQDGADAASTDAQLSSFYLVALDA